MKKITLLLFILVVSLRLAAQSAEEKLEAHIDYEVERRDAANETITEEEMKNKIFSAPATFSFYGSGGSEAVYYTWFLYKKGDLENPIARYPDKDITRYTFEEFGEYVIKLEVADNDSNTSEDT